MQTAKCKAAKLPREWGDLHSAAVIGMLCVITLSRPLTVTGNHGVSSCFPSVYFSLPVATWTASN